jgi:hypothetical protein
MDQAQDLPVALIVELTSEIERLPDDNRQRLILGLGIPVINVDAATASAATKVTLALDRLGLRF